MKRVERTIGLNRGEIGRVIRLLRGMGGDSLATKMELIRLRVAGMIADAAQADFRNAVSDIMFWTDELGNKQYEEVKDPEFMVTVQNDGENCELVIARGQTAIFIEFGTGVHYNGSAGTSPHPRGEELGMVIGSYGKGMGRRNTWAWDEPGKGIVFTHGIPSKAPMYNAAQTVRSKIADVAREVFK